MHILIQCKDSVGLVASISKVIADLGINIVSMREFVDVDANLFFARLALVKNERAADIHRELQAVLPEQASITIQENKEKKIVVMVTKEYHCLGDILLRNHFKTLGASVQAVVGNHPTLADITSRFEVPFHLVSSEGKSKEIFEAEILAVLENYEIDYLILAKFMRILSPHFNSRFSLRIINIHHSFLPAFAGAKPYVQAYQRGVKLIGATAHFVTNELDEGPIIAQQIIPVNHAFSSKDMMKAGKEVEKSVLAKAMQNVLEDRVLVYNNKTVVFE